MKTNKRISNILFIIWAGGTALLSYSLVYALRKPFTAAVYEEMELFGIDYKIAVTAIQIIGYLVAKFFGIKIISELKRENRFKFFAGSIILAELSLVGFGAIAAPYNAFVMFFNGLSLGCIWGVIFSFIEGRKVTDILASLLSVSIVFSSGLSKSIGLHVMNDLGVDQFWMPALIGAFALPLLFATAYSLIKLPHPNDEDIEHKSLRKAIGRDERRSIFRSYMPILILILVANFIIVTLRDIKEDFLVNIIDMEGQSSWLFAKVDTVVTIIILTLFALTSFIKRNIAVLISLLSVVVVSNIAMAYVSINHQTLNLSPVVWLFAQSLPLYIAYLAFQSVFFDRFIACFKIQGNVGYFIALVDFIGYIGTVTILLIKEGFNIEVDWFEAYNNMSATVGIISAVSFTLAIIFIIRKYRLQSSPQPIQYRHPKRIKIEMAIVNNQ